MAGWSCHGHKAVKTDEDRLATYKCAAGMAGPEHVHGVRVSCRCLGLCFSLPQFQKLGIAGDVVLRLWLGSMVEGVERDPGSWC